MQHVNSEKSVFEKLKTNPNLKSFKESEKFLLFYHIIIYSIVRINIIFEKKLLKKIEIM